jgi:CHRD domain
VEKDCNANNSPSKGEGDITMKWGKMSFLAVLLLSLVVPVFQRSAIAHDVKTDLTGYEETPQALSTPGSGDFQARIRHEDQQIDYTLSYRDLESTVTQAHIHFGLPAIGGGIVVFLCTNLAPPAGVPTPQACPAAPATITGTISPADVGATQNSIDQGIGLGQFAELERAIRAGATYVNVHTTGRPGGEIRGQLTDITTSFTTTTK